MVPPAIAAPAPPPIAPPPPGPAARPSFGRLMQVGAGKTVEIAVEHARHVAHLVARAMVLDHRVGMKHVGADLGAEVDVLGVALLTGDLLTALPLLTLEELGPEHLHRLGLVGGLRALVLTLNDDARRLVRDPHGGVGLVDVLTPGSAG